MTLNRLLALLAMAASVQTAAAQPVSIPDDAVITLERTVCGGECPAYTVSINARGTVAYEGREFVRVVGRQTDRIPRSQVAALLETAERIGFFELNDRYRFIRNPDGTETIVTDLPTAFVTITRAGRTKRVEDYLRAPAGLRELERQIDETTRTKRWVFIDEPTLAGLARNGWKPTAEERSELFRKAVQYDDLPVLKGLLGLGADPNAGYFGTDTPPLMMVRSVDAAKLLLAAGADPRKRNIYGGTPLAAAAFLPAEVAELLVKAGVPVDAPDNQDGRTPLWSAACAGNAGVVAILLNAGASPETRAAGMTALECATTQREANRVRQPLAIATVEPFAVDFDTVIAVLERRR